VVNAYTAMAVGDGEALSEYRPGAEIPAGWTRVEHVGDARFGGFVPAEYELAIGGARRVALLFARLGDFQEECLWEQHGGCNRANPSPAGGPYAAFTRACPGNAAACVAGSEVPAQQLGRDGMLALLGGLIAREAPDRVSALDATGVEFDRLGDATRRGPEAGYVEYWDHYYSAMFALSAVIEALPARSAPPRVRLYRGYTVARSPANVSAEPLDGKAATFARYAMFDADIVKPPTPAAFVIDHDQHYAGAYRVDDPESWQAREYAAESVSWVGQAGALATPGGCVGAGLAQVPCTGAPEWTSRDGRGLQLVGGTSCIAVAADGTVRLDACATEDANVLLTFANGQIRTRSGRCLELVDQLIATDCHDVREDDHVTGEVPASQRFSLQP